MKRLGEWHAQAHERAHGGGLARMKGRAWTCPQTGGLANLYADEDSGQTEGSVGDESHGRKARRWPHEQRMDPRKKRLWMN